jgi:HPt (histidine-containing phosphotransfer) domain-containing protein
MTNHIDLTELNKVADGDQEFMKETITLLLQEIPENIEHINQYVTNNDLVSLKKIVHKMKSSFMLIGMRELWPIVGIIEKSDSPEEILQQVPAYVKICRESVDELKSI